MNEAKSTHSEARTPQDVGAFWDTHDLSEYWEQTEPAAFEIEGKLQSVYYPVDTALSQKLRKIAVQHGISAETLLNL